MNHYRNQFSKLIEVDPLETLGLILIKPDDEFLLVKIRPYYTLIRNPVENLPKKFGHHSGHVAISGWHEPLEIHITKSVSENLWYGLGLPDVLGAWREGTWVLASVVTGFGYAP